MANSQNQDRKYPKWKHAQVSTWNRCCSSMLAASVAFLVLCFWLVCQVASLILTLREGRLVVDIFAVNHEYGEYGMYSYYSLYLYSFSMTVLVLMIPAAYFFGQTSNRTVENIPDLEQQDSSVPKINTSIPEAYFSGQTSNGIPDLEQQDLSVPKISTSIPKAYFFSQASNGTVEKIPDLEQHDSSVPKKNSTRSILRHGPTWSSRGPVVGHVQFASLDLDLVKPKKDWGKQPEVNLIDAME